MSHRDAPQFTKSEQELSTTKQRQSESKPVRESRRSTRVPLKVVIKTQGITKPLTCDGETIVVNLHGALISTAAVLTQGMRVEVQVYLTGKRAQAQVVYIDPTSLCAAGSPWRSQRTFGEYRCRRTTGLKMVKDHEHPAARCQVIATVEQQPIEHKKGNIGRCPVRWNVEQPPQK